MTHAAFFHSAICTQLKGASSACIHHVPLVFHSKMGFFAKVGLMWTVPKLTGIVWLSSRKVIIAYCKILLALTSDKVLPHVFNLNVARKDIQPSDKQLRLLNYFLY